MIEVHLTQVKQLINQFSSIRNIQYIVYSILEIVAVREFTKQCPIMSYRL